MKRIFSYLAPYKKRMALGVTIKILGTVSELMIPFLLTYILENVIVTLEIPRILLYGGVMVVCSVGACVGNVTANRMAARVTADFSVVMRRELFARTLYLSARDTDNFTVPSLESRITSDTYNVQNFIGMMQRMGIRAPILLLGGVTITLFMDGALALVMIATMPIIFITVYSVARRSVPLYTKVQKSTDDMIRVVREDVLGVRVIKALSKNEYENRRYDTYNRALTRQECHAGVIMNAVNPIMTLLMNLGIAGVIAVAAYRVTNGTSSAATVIAFMQYFTLISMALMSLSRMFIMYTKCAASARRISAVLDTPDAFPQESDDGRGDTDVKISLEHVTFSYLGKKPNLEDISLSVPKGGTLGIIGATGSGKSTFVKLLLRFYDPDSGVIRIDGKKISSYSREELTSLFGVALQNDFLYADTVEENIRFGRDIPDEEIRRAAKIAQAHDFISAMPEGYRHKISSKGTNLSGGQRQRILIARAIAARPEILILDDSSSALDYKTDASLRQALKESMSDSTVITVAQRVSSVKNCDLILVLDQGRIIGRGRHEELMENCAEYRQISDSQMGGAFLD
ncbi:MAG: ABC transporter ATP-binding protein/permease [Roseburia sp.]|nr:ABC transporter ATP-binding protein/permease [Roseburia sp.]MCM1098044.1 ABC transporter ATP-binding protein/permease [Ruminococcus flavefaciens]